MKTDSLLEELQRAIDNTFRDTSDQFGRHSYAVRFVTAAMEDIQAYLNGTGPMPCINYRSPVVEQPETRNGQLNEEMPTFLGNVQSNPSWREEAAQYDFPENAQVTMSNVPEGWPVTPQEQRRREKLADGLAAYNGGRG